MKRKVLFRFSAATIMLLLAFGSKTVDEKLTIKNSRPILVSDAMWRYEMHDCTELLNSTEKFYFNSNDTYLLAKIVMAEAES